MGWNVGNREGRASTAIVSFDRKAMTLVAESGRVYQLEGVLGPDADAAHVWRIYVRLNGYVAVAADRRIAKASSGNLKTACGSLIKIGSLH
ncbi:MAG TPA: hypothetical protein VF928_07300 [Usitatibacteraceae bacterium]